MSRDSGAGAIQRTVVPVGSTVVLVVSKGAAPSTSANSPVPNATGMAQADALNALQVIGMNAQVFTQPSQTHTRGKVIAQWPSPGEIVAPGTSAALLVSSGAVAEGAALVGVPTVVGQPEASAQAALERGRLQSSVLRAFSPTIPEGVVMAQVPDERTVVVAKPSKTWLWAGAALAVLLVAIAIVFLLGRSPSSAEMVEVPGVVGETQEKAEASLTDAGLEIGTIKESSSNTATVGTVMSQDPAQGASVAKGSKVELVIATSSELVDVPDVVGQTRDEALQTLARAQLEVKVTEAVADAVDAGTVVSQSPRAEQQVPANTEVGIVIGVAPASTNVDVPDVLGQGVGSAKQSIAGAGLTAKTVDSFSAAPEGEVIGQAPGGGESVAPGTQVVLLVSAGPPPTSQTVTVPNVVGMLLSEAETTLTDAGLKVSSFETDGSTTPADTVLYQTPSADATAPEDSQVVLVVSSGK